MKNICHVWSDFNPLFAYWVWVISVSFLSFFTFCSTICCPIKYSICYIYICMYVSVFVYISSQFQMASYERYYIIVPSSRIVCATLYRIFGNICGWHGNLIWQIFHWFIQKPSSIQYIWRMWTIRFKFHILKQHLVMYFIECCMSSNLNGMAL